MNMLIDKELEGVFFSDACNLLGNKFRVDVT
jgi:hypothetical protein